MAVTLDFDWTKSDKEELVDRLNRGKYAEFLTNYLCGYTDNSYVMNLNAEWGAGKTWFLKRWQQTIKTQHPTTYIDAWQNDFSDDPLLTVIAGVFDALDGLCANAESRRYKQDALRKSGQFFKAFAKGVVQHQLEKYLGDGAELLRNGISAVSDSAVSLIIQGHKQKLETIEGFKKEINNWLTMVSEESKLRKPMFVFIDELDRCRPTYAIELLETVKHLFDIPGLVFVIATNTDQLQHSIKAVYGQDFDAQRYLYRFFNRSFTLKQPDLLEFIQVQPVFKDHLFPALQSTCNDEVTTNEVELAETLTAIAEGFAFDLRTTLQWLDQLSAIFSDEAYRNRYFWLWCAILLAVKLKSPYVFSLLFVLYKVNDHQTSEEKQTLMKDVGAIMAEPRGEKAKALRLHISQNIAHEYMQRGFGNSKLFYPAECALDWAWVLDISDKLASRNFKKRIKEWPANSGGPDPKEAITMAAFKCWESGALREGYVNLVELAADLE